MLLKNGIINGEGFEECFLKFPAICFSTENDLKTHSGVILSFCWAWVGSSAGTSQQPPISMGLGHSYHGNGGLAIWQSTCGPASAWDWLPKGPLWAPHTWGMMLYVWPTQAWRYRVTIPWVGDCASPTASTPLRGLQHEVLWAKPSLQTLKLGCRVGLCVPGCAPL